ncbi:MAG: transcriptional regulator FtrA, partial [Pseudomonadota bacterium]
MPTPTTRSKAFNPLVVALAYDGLCAFEFSCTAEVFGLSRPEVGPRWYRFETCSSGGRRVKGQYGLAMSVDAGLDRMTQAGTIMVPGWQGIDVPVPAPILDALRLAHARGARLLSICSG